MFSVCHCFMCTLTFIVRAYSTWAFIPIMFNKWSVNLSDFCNSRAVIATWSFRELVMCLVINLAFLFFFFSQWTILDIQSFFFVVVEWYFYNWKVFLSLSPSVSVSTFVHLFLCVLYLVGNVQSHTCKVMLLKCVMWCIIQNSMPRHKCVLCVLGHVSTTAVIDANFSYLGGELASTDM